MLPSHLPQDEKYKFVIDTRRGLHIVFATDEMLSRPKPVAPLWFGEAGDERSFDALLRWVGVRRAKWQDWGRLAETIGPDAFYRHMSDLMVADPIVECTGAVVQQLDDPRGLVMGEMTQGPDGLRIEELYRHQFDCAASRDRFFDWFNTDRNCYHAASLIQIGYARGTAALGKALDELAAQTKPLARAERRRRARAAA